MMQKCVFAILSASLALAGCASMGQRGGSEPAGAEGEVSAATVEANRRNPFVGVKFFLNPEYVANVEETAKKHPSDAEAIRKVKQYPTAVWIDSIAHIANLPGWLDEAKKQQAANGAPTLTVIVVYDMPNRDCAAQASAGELKVSQNGAERYRTEFIDPIVEHLKKYPDLPIAIILEPDSLPNLATNMNLPTCSEARKTYIDSTAYGIRKLQLPNVSIYLDVAHSGWLGWDGNREKAAKIYKQVLKQAGGVDTIRGFATNTANYTHLNNRDGAALEPTNPCPNELAYVKKMIASMADHGIKHKGFIIDTARNGKGKIRKVWGHWCNIKGAGLGERPTVSPEPFVDAYFWLKPPGESDGTSDSTQPRYDPECGSNESAKNAPQAGTWFESYFLDLVRNATPPL
jgi:cellulose 1,4-beta-cellobiosidase